MTILPTPCPACAPSSAAGMRARRARLRAGLIGLALLTWAAAGRANGGAADTPLRAGAELEHWMRQTAQTALDSQQAAASPPGPGASAASTDGTTVQARVATRVEVLVGRLDPRLKLAPCQKVSPYLPAGSRATGVTRIGLRCTQGPKAWNVYLPVTVKVFARSLVAATALPAGTVLQPRHLIEAEVDVAASTDPAIAQPQLAVGRTLARNMSPGDALRRADLRRRQWFAAGDTVRVVAVGPGYQIAADAQALGPGLDGQVVRARIEGGRVVSGVATADRRIEIAL